MATFSNKEREVMNDAVQEMLRKGYTPEQVMKAMADVFTDAQ